MNDVAAALPLAAISVPAEELELPNMRLVAADGEFAPSFYAELAVNGRGNLRLWVDGSFEANFIHPLSQNFPFAELPAPLADDILTAAVLELLADAPLQLRRLTAKPPPLAVGNQLFDLREDSAEQNGKTLLRLAIVADEEATAAIAEFLPPRPKAAVAVPMIISRGRAQLRPEELLSLAVGDFVFYRPGQLRAVVGNRQFAVIVAADGGHRLAPLAADVNEEPSGLEVETARIPMVAAQLGSLSPSRKIELPPNDNRRQTAVLSLNGEVIARGQLQQLGGRHALYITARSPLQHQAG